MCMRVGCVEMSRSRSQVSPTAPKILELKLLKGQQEVARLKISISSRWLKDYKVREDKGRGGIEGGEARERDRVVNR